MRTDANAQNTAATFPWSLMFVRTGFVLTSPAWCAAQTGTFDVAGAQTDGARRIGRALPPLIRPTAAR